MTNILRLHLTTLSVVNESSKNYEGSYGERTSAGGYKNCDPRVIINELVHVAITLGHVQAIFVMICQHLQIAKLQSDKKSLIFAISDLQIIRRLH